MTGRSHILPEIMQAAQTDGDTTQPRALLNALDAIENPLMALASPDQANAFFGSFYSEYGFLNAPAAANPLELEQRSRWVALLRWLLRELREWRAENDPGNRVLVAIFIVAQTNDWDDAFWEQVPQDIGNNADLVHRLKTLLGSFSTGRATRGGMVAPIWEVEAVEAFDVADREGDWAGIGSRLGLFEHQFVPNTALVQPTRCLYRCGISHLLEAVAHLHQTVIALQLASALRVDRRLAVAVASSNPYIEFASVYGTISGRHAARELSPNDEQTLKDILLKVATDEPRWRGWMQLFNAYPLRYPTLQGPLGAALAEAQEAAIDAYVNALVFSVRPIKPPAPNPNRQCIASCLRSFRTNAPPDKRATLWTKAYERWSTWDFDRANPETHLLNVSRCDVDYAIVGFVTECKNDSDRGDVPKNIIRELNVLENDWYVSSLDITSRFHRVLSRFQPYAHAVYALANGEDWLTDTKVYYPFVPSENAYFVIKYRLDLGN